MAETGKVAVVTGASSGIGRATAETLARHGWRLVLNARERERLDEVVAACGGEADARAVAGDVGDAATHDALLREAVQAFGGCSLWVNNAGVIAFGRVDKIPAEVQERVIRTNLIGTLLGARVAIAHFLSRGRGQLINVASMDAHVPQAYGAAYTASKYGVRGLTEALRAELHDHPGILVGAVNPAAIDTPAWESVANYTGEELQPLQPLYEAQDVADAILGLIGSRKAEVYVGDAARLAAAAHAIAPETTGRAIAGLMEHQLMTGRPAPHDPGNVARPRGSGQADGGFTERGLASGDTLDRLLRVAGAGAVALGLGWALTRMLGGEPTGRSRADGPDRELDHGLDRGTHDPRDHRGGLERGRYAGWRGGGMHDGEVREGGRGHGRPGGPEPISEGEAAFRRAGW